MPRTVTSGTPFSSASNKPKSASARRSAAAKKGPKSTTPNASSTKPKNAPRRKDEQDLDGLNVYDFTQAPVKNSRTANQRFELTREEAQLAGIKKRTRVQLDDDSEGGDSDDSMATRIRRAALVIAGETALVVQDDDDEDLDSDAAWNDDSDQERWGQMFGKKGSAANQTKRAVRKSASPAPLDVDMDESDLESTASVSKSHMRPKPQNFVTPGLDALDSEEDEEDEEEEEESDDASEPSLPSDLEDEDSEDDADNLADFVSKLPAGTKRKAEAEQDAQVVEPETTTGKRRRVLTSMHGPGGRDDAGEFGINPNNKLSLASLVASDPSLKSTAASLLRSSDSKDNASILKSGTLAAPLPTVVLDRLAREAAYEQTSQEGAKWGAVMKRIKEAEQLKFPLQVGGTASQGSSKDRQRGRIISGGDLIGGFKATNELESAVTKLLESANLKDSQIAQAEKDALEGQDLTVEEVAERRAELRRQRELLFREESRRKRISKIKSKTYRKLARKRAGKDGEMDLEDLRRIDPERAEEEQNKMELARAKERATLKHTAKGGRWAQGQHGAGEIDGKRKEIEDMLAQGERLRRKIQGRNSDDSDSGSEESDEEESGEEDVRAQAFNQLASLREKQAELNEAVSGSKPSGIFAMKFMQNAALKDKSRVDQEEEELRQQLEKYDDEGIESDEDGSDEEQENVQRKGGRLVLSGTGAGVSNVPSSSLRASNTSRVIQIEDDETPVELDNSVRPLASSTTSSQSNPWAEGATDSGGRMRKKNTIVASKDTSATEKALQALKKQTTSKTQGAKQKLNDDALVDISVDPATMKKSLPLKDESDDEDADGDVPGPSKGLKAFDQRDLVAQAFAGDNVVEDFAAEKQRAIEKDAPQEKDLTLAGWGSWGGKGVKKNKNAKKFTKSIPGIEVTQRKDFNRGNVIINEKQAKATKYLSTSLPYPYTSQAQYERALSSTTIDPEVSTMAGFQRGITPRIIKKPGAILAPLKKLHNA